ncbi:hypothetical protein [Candidatus Methanoperedens nitratireducens]|uniref:Uncharacterized protein n=1 Tax=Candidatus Methanoperedens nitratireducens TaxID=1392998 RepID=A0A284VLZ6_9EURY|nr:hypothetical protein [Candidatus Methanoperedens nitroreducens]SNQ60227.1 hypothetical protein MNV_1700005 [Candidatus Methanoperedens nitroreducens]
MDIFDVLGAISKRKITLMHTGINESEALTKAKIDISIEYHISLFDIEKLAGQKTNRTRVNKNRRSFS